MILRPTLVYGPGSALWTDGPLAALRQGGVILPDPPGRAPLVHVDDVVQAVLRAALLPDPGRAERFLISGAEGVDWAEYYRGLAQIAGRGEIRLEPMARPVLSYGSSAPSAAARISAWGRRLVGRERSERAVALLQAVAARGPGAARRRHGASLHVQPADQHRRRRSAARLSSSGRPAGGTGNHRRGNSGDRDGLFRVRKPECRNFGQPGFCRRIALLILTPI